ncbi:hypothetical protein Taro_055242 [Colocasia esculenta]|uniref:PLAT domain-containing protein n=1 Tax=Colocasia esculenta TaxID=4460 RepID=A0A843XSR0_COLES|nr:hypothetical protein [Colocasia esculenta]
MAFARRILLSSTLLVVILACAAAADSQQQQKKGADAEECVYTLYVRTGSVIKGGTDSKIGLTLGDSEGRQVRIDDLEKWGGLMGSGHDYYERGNLDVFSGRVPCGLSTPLCSLNLTSDGSGPHHGWYCEYVELTATGPHSRCHQSLFYIRQWLANDAPPYQLYAYIDGCERALAREPGKPFVVGNRGGLAASM